MSLSMRSLFLCPLIGVLVFYFLFANRTSKRVRDKLEQFEETKRKREEEEQEMLAKYRIVLSKFGMDIENAYISGSTPDSLKPEDIFPSGISGLLAMFNRYLERPNALVHASTIEHVQQYVSLKCLLTLKRVNWTT